MLKRSKQKELILSVLQSHPFHPTAVWIYDEVRKEMPRISLATVYRNLRQFRERREILELRFDGDVSHFDARTDKHGHIWCETCNRILDVEEPVDTEFNSRVAQETGFEVSDYQVILRGLCQECRFTHSVKPKKLV